VETTNFIVHGLEITGDGSAKPLTELKEIEELMRSERLSWIHLEAEHPQTRAWLSENQHEIDPIILDALLADETRPRLLEHGEGVMMILRGVNLNEDAEPEDMISIRLYIDQNNIISLRRRKLRAVQDIVSSFEQGSGPTGAGDFCVRLISRLFERMEPVILELDQRTDDVEEIVIEAPDSNERAEIIDIRKKSIVLRRYIAPQRDAVMRLKTLELPWLDNTHKRYLQESIDRNIRYVEDLDAIRERAAIVKDELANALADKLNRNMYMLSIIAAIFLPLGFLTGLLGINIAGIPGAEYPHAFSVFSAGLVILVIVQFLVFRKLKWF
jgi:zinc transporter